MTDMRAARKAAEKAARDRLGGILITAAGELGAALAQQQLAAASVGDAEQCARDHVAQAQREAERIVAEARSHVAATDEQYRHSYDSALAAGWSPAALCDMGYAAPPARKRGRSLSTSTSPAAVPPSNEAADDRVA